MSKNEPEISKKKKTGDKVEKKVNDTNKKENNKKLPKKKAGLGIPLPF